MTLQLGHSSEDDWVLCRPLPLSGELAALALLRITGFMAFWLVRTGRLAFSRRAELIAPVFGFIALGWIVGY